MHGSHAIHVVDFEFGQIVLKFYLQVLSVESLLKLDVSSCSIKIEKHVLRELQLAYCTALVSSCCSVAEIAQLPSSRCISLVPLAHAINYFHGFYS
jgi:hypothetical protein